MCQFLKEIDELRKSVIIKVYEFFTFALKGFVVIKTLRGFSTLMKIFFLVKRSVISGEKIFEMCFNCAEYGFVIRKLYFQRNLFEDTV